MMTDCLNLCLQISSMLQVKNMLFTRQNNFLFKNGYPGIALNKLSISFNI